MKIFITNLEAYNNGKLQGEWVTLPLKDFDNDFKAILKRIGNPEEYFITDYECDYYEIDEYEDYEDIEKLNKLAEYYNGLDKDDQTKLKFYIEDQGIQCDEDIIDVDLDDILFYPDMSLEELAEEFVNEGVFGNIPDSIRSYIDFKAIARDLVHDGYTETDEGVFCCV
jgi:antirestriction protein